MSWVVQDAQELKVREITDRRTIVGKRYEHFAFGASVKMIK